MITKKNQAFIAVCLLVMTLTTGLTSVVQAADSTKPHLVIELNDLKQQQAPSACRLSLLVENRLGNAITDLAFELVLFGKDQRIMQLLAVAAGPFPKSKSRVKQFDLKSIACNDIGRVLLNTITRCTTGDLTPDACLALTRTRSRTDIKLSY